MSRARRTPSRLLLGLALAGVAIVGCRGAPAEAPGGKGAACEPERTGAVVVSLRAAGEGAEAGVAGVAAVEEALARVPGVARVTSTLWEERAAVIAHLAPSRAVTPALEAARAAVEGALPRGPDAFDATLRAVQPAEEVAELVLWGLAPAHLGHLADAIAERVAREPGVRAATPVGAPRPRIVVAVDAGRLIAFGLTAQEVAAALARGDERPLGARLAPADGATLRARGDDPIETLRDVPLGPGLHRLSDVAELRLDHAPAPARVFRDGQRAVGLRVAFEPPFTRSTLAALAGDLRADAPPGLEVDVLRRDESTLAVEVLADTPDAAATERAVAALLERAHGTGLVAAATAWVGVGRGGALRPDEEPDDPGRAELYLALRQAPSTAADLATLRDALAAPALQVIPRPDAQPALVVEVRADDPHRVEDAARVLVTTLAALPGVESAHAPDLRIEHRLEVHLDRERMATLGVTAADVTLAVAVARGGLVVGRLDAYDVTLVEDAGETRLNPARALALRGAGGEAISVPLDAIASVSWGAHARRASRRDGAPAMTIELVPGPGAGAEVCAAIRAHLEAAALGPEVTLELADPGRLCGC